MDFITLTDEHYDEVTMNLRHIIWIKWLDEGAQVKMVDKTIHVFRDKEADKLYEELQVRPY
jgi:hypothetical protein